MSRALLGFLVLRYWALCLACALPPILIGMVTGLLYPSYSQKREAFKGFLPMVQRFIGGDLLDMFSPLGFFNLPFQHPLTLMSFAAAVAIPAVAFPAGERGRKTLELLLAGRLQRGQLVGTVALVVVPISIIVGLAPIAGTALGSHLSGVSGQIHFASYRVASCNAMALAFWLGSACLLISVLSRDRAAAMGRYGALVFLSLVILFTAQVWEEGSWLRSLTPFGYYQPARIVAGVGDAARDAAILIGTGLALVVAAAVLEVGRKEA